MTFFKLTIKSIIRDRIFLIISFLILIYAFIPVFSYFSLRQLQEISITLSITLNSFILLLLSLFGGIATIWRDIERKYTFTLLSYPVSRIEYLVGRYLGFVFILLLITLVNFFLSVIVIKISASFYKSDLPIVWGNIFAAFIFSFLKYCGLLSICFFFSSFSTSFFIPVFSTVAIYIAGNSIQGIYEYVVKEGHDISSFVKFLVKIIYYFLPNFSTFDLIPYATYSIPINTKSLLISTIYFFLYFVILFIFTIIIFNKRDFE